VAKEAAGRAGDVASDSIFALVLQHEHFFRQVDGLPDVQGFLDACADSLRLILLHRWRNLLPERPHPLAVNILINPNLFFCHRDAMRGRYHCCPAKLFRRRISFV